MDVKSSRITNIHITEKNSGKAAKGVRVRASESENERARGSLWFAERLAEAANINDTIHKMELSISFK